MGASKPQPPINFPEPSRDRLDSWKEIAAYLKRDERTVRRWEAEGLPVHRKVHKKQASVYAYRREIDAWWHDGRHRLEQAEQQSSNGAETRSSAPAVLPGNTSLGSASRSPRNLEPQPTRHGESSRRIHALQVIGAVIVLACVALVIHLWKTHKRALNVEEMHMVRLTESGKAEDVAISPSGQYVAYVLRDGEKRGLNLRQVATGSDVQILPAEAMWFRGLAFSPDGNYIFFSRTDKENFQIDSLYQVPVLGGTPQALIHGVDSPISFSPDGRQFAFVRESAVDDMDELIIANADGSGERLIARPGQGVEAGPAWSPDGHTIAMTTYEHAGGVHIWAVSPSDGSKHLIFSKHALIGRILWLPDGSGLLAAMGDEGNHIQIWHISYPGGQAKRITNDLSDYSFRVLDLTRDAKSLVTVEDTVSSDLWVVPAGDAANARQITSGGRGVMSLSAGPEGSIVFVNSQGGLSLIHDDGNAQAFAARNMHNIMAASACRDGHHVVFDSVIEGRWNIWRMDADGSNITQLTRSEGAIFPVCSPDSQWVVYSDQQLWQIPIRGGTPRPVQTKNIVGPWRAFSPDGRFFAYNSGPEVSALDLLTVIPAAGGEPLYTFPWPSDATVLRWAPDGNGLDYILTRNRVGNIWRQPVPKGSPRQLTNFTSDRIFSFDWSSDGKQLYVARGSISSDIILITNFR